MLWRLCANIVHRTRPRLAKEFSTFVSDPRWPGWQAVIGIEVHAQIRSRAKLFSPSSNSQDISPNAHVSLFDAAFPGTLPVLNRRCVDLAVRTALALGCDIHQRSSFDRKHYFYADLPSGYQITQKYAPLARNGRVSVDDTGRVVRIEQIQLEQDTAKSTKSPGAEFWRIDLNRAGAGLMEIVSLPDMRTPEEAGAYVRSLQAVLRAVGASDGKMEQGSLRCDVNVSINREGEPFGTRCEIKNLNSVKFLMSAILSEVQRHISLLSLGRSIAQETRGFDEERVETYTLRSKEDAPDYRYMPDPNLPPLILTEGYIKQIAKSMPELPHAIRSRLQSQYGISARDTDILMSIESGTDVGFDGEPSRGGAVSYFEQVAKHCNPKVAINWRVPCVLITHELVGQLVFRDEPFSANPVTVTAMRDVLSLLKNKTLTGTSAKTLIRHILNTKTTKPVAVLVQELSLQASSPESLEKLCQNAIDALPQESEAVRKGNQRVLMKLVGRVMKHSRGTANAKDAAATLKQMLS
ncbi:Glutamyl-tRNA amidotransferase B subunit [Cantharellus anzutake]|uniref:Glutamyl-tRNA amidotransferase B subunit n=1 Tax=Cantharellus anzutake TaxID=1750568 RepID=UPI0019058841|nr:Glutamyl-tRNA amidotransferase B subunit [Cantharellus anzutake]KAF8317016.1 Glutamyl-tRNA amidotransferase B subunit [Cantharellus anzutake]